MNFYLLGASVLLLLFWFLLSLLEKLPYLLALEVKDNNWTYAFNILRSVLDFVFSYSAVLFLSMALALTVISLNLEKELTNSENKVALAILFLIFIIHGPVQKILKFLELSYFLKRGLPRWSIVFFADSLVTLIPCTLLLLSLMGSDYRKAFLYSLLPIIILSLLLKFTFSLIHFELTT